MSHFLEFSFDGSFNSGRLRFLTLMLSFKFTEFDYYKQELIFSEIIKISLELIINYDF